MTTAADERSTLRVWLALDESPRSAAALAAATALAEALDAELAGLFVEDVNLQHLFGLPFASEYCVLTGVQRTLTPADIELAWRAEARMLQRQLEQAAVRQRVRWSFRVARGSMSAEVNTLAGTLDPVVLGRRGRGSAARAVQAFVERGPAHSGPVLVLFEGMPASAASLAATLVARGGGELVLLVHADSADAYRDACTQAQKVAASRGVAESRCLWLRALGAAELLQAARQEDAACLVLADRARFLGDATFERMVDELDCPVVLTHRGHRNESAIEQN